jgi:hypothetical protein
MLEAILSDPAMKNVNFDISWDEVAKYIVSTPESLRVSAEMINRYPDRFLFGTDASEPGKVSPCLLPVRATMESAFSGGERQSPRVKLRTAIR